MRPSSLAGPKRLLPPKRGEHNRKPERVAGTVASDLYAGFHWPIQRLTGDAYQVLGNREVRLREERATAAETPTPKERAKQPEAPKKGKRARVIETTSSRERAIRCE